MIIVRRWCWVGLLIWGGCAGETPSEQASPAVTPAPLSTRRGGDPSGVTGLEVDRIGPADGYMSQTPEGAIKQLISDVRAGNLKRAYDFLPAMFQRDLDLLVRELGERVDPAVWGQLFDTLDKGVDLARSQKTLILQTLQRGQQVEDLEGLNRSWEDLVTMLDLLVHSDLADPKKLKAFDSRAYLEQTGNAVFGKLLTIGGEQNPLESLAQVEAQTVEIMDQTATVLLKTAENPAGQKVEFIQLDGRWVPKSLAEGWPDAVASLRQSLSQLTPEVMAERKESLLDGLAMIDGAFDRMGDAETPDQMMGAVFPLFAQALKLQKLWPTRSAERGAVTLIVRGRFDDAAQTKLLRELEQLTDNPERAEYNASPTSEEFVVTIKPVADPVAFAEKLTLGKNRELDLESRTIRIDLTEPSDMP